MLEDSFQCAGHLLRARRGGDQGQPRRVEARRGADRLGSGAVEGHDVARLAGEADAGTDRDIFCLDQRDDMRAALGRDNRDVPGVAGERHMPRAAAELVVGADGDVAVLIDRSDGHRPWRRLDLGLRQQPPGEQRLGERHRRGEPAGDAQHGEPVGDLRPGAAEVVGDPGQRQARLFERIPQRLGPFALFGLVDGVGFAKVLENLGRGIDDDRIRHLSSPRRSGDQTRTPPA